MFSSIGIIGKQSDGAKVASTLARLVHELGEHGRRALIDAPTAALLGRSDGLAVDELAQRCDLIIVVGGDGTFLHAAREVSGHGVPLVGINLGRLGFLVDISPDDIASCIHPILAGEYEEETRVLLRAELPGHPPQLALNDVVVHKWNSARMVEVRISIDGRFVNDERSDGLIVATPTGSTAYALSGGGPLIHPDTDALVLVPICPHTLSNRPLVVAGHSAVELEIRTVERAHVRLSCDGQSDLELDPADPRIRIARAEAPLRLLHPRGYDYYEILRHKLGWGGHPSASSSC